jgi:DNA segregation ATPase FtsK/SpoIIIE-like protein
MVTSSIFFASILSKSLPALAGGLFGSYVSSMLNYYVGTTGSIVVIITLNIIGLIMLGLISLSKLFQNIELSEYPEDKMKNLIRTLWKFFNSIKTKTVKNQNSEIPLNTIQEDLQKQNKKMPWITKERIKVAKPQKTPAPSSLVLQSAETPYEIPVLSLPFLPTLNLSDTNEVTPIKNFIREEIEEITEIDEPMPIEVTIIEDFDSDEITFLETENLSNNTGIPEIVYEKYEEIEYSDVDNFDQSNQPEEESDNFNGIFQKIPITEQYEIPTNYLASSKPQDIESWKNEIRKNSTLLVSTLAEFGIEANVINVNRGPVITLYELQIAPGIKVTRIVSLSDDIAMALAALRVRIVAPIPGKSAVGVEIPNTVRETVTMGDVIKTQEYNARTGYLKVALGKDILGKPIALDLKQLPHLLIAGATGSGKSVCVNGIISSLIYNYDPNYVRFIMVDPKMVELQIYNGMPHLLTPVITEPLIAPTALKWAIYEMDRRYRLLSTFNTRDIERYNEKISSIKQSEKLPYIVIIIDELHDLMMVASKEVESYITRLAQKARAIGIHLVLATQRPSVDVITGVIKANIPARIAFQVAQKNDSRTILDQNGAEQLLGKGDMLYLPPTSSFPIRVQGAFISEDESIQIVKHLKRYGEPEYIDIEAYLFAAESERESEDGDDELFVEALKIVEESRKASASYLQRKLSIGYNRAARIIELMEERGYIGPQQGSRPREIYI